MSTRHYVHIKYPTHLLIILLLTALIAACSNADAGDNSTSAQPEIAPATIKLYLAAPQIEYAGIYAAISQRFFEAEKLDVELIFWVTGDDSTAPPAAMDVLEQGEFVFIDGTAETLLERRERGVDVVAVLTQYQRDSRSIVSSASKAIEEPQDLIGKRLLILPGNETITSVFFRTVGINEEDVTRVGLEGEGIDWVVTQIMTGAVDGLVFSIEVAAQMEAVGLGADWVAFYDYGVQSYANILFTSGHMIDEHPDIVQRFVNAVLRGLQYVVEQPEAVAAWFVEHYGDQLHPIQLEVQDEAILAIIPLIQTATSKPGMMSADTWEYLNQQLVEMGLLETGVDTTEAYTMKFLDAYYK